MSKKRSSFRIIKYKHIAIGTFGLTVQLVEIGENLFKITIVMISAAGYF